MDDISEPFDAAEASEVAVPASPLSVADDNEIAAIEAVHIEEAEDANKSIDEVQFGEVEDPGVEGASEIRSSECGLGLGCGLRLKASSRMGPGGRASLRNS